MCDTDLPPPLFLANFEHNLPKGGTLFGEYPPGVFFKGCQIFGEKIRGLKFLGENLRGLKSISKFDQIFSKFPFFWKIQIQTSQKSSQFHK